MSEKKMSDEDFALIMRIRKDAFELISKATTRRTRWIMCIVIHLVDRASQLEF